jgi:hydrogenase-4 component C
MSMVGLIGIGVLQAALLLLAAPLFSGFSRVLRAKIQTRKGPPLLQNYRDLVKLMKRQEVVSEQAGWIFRAAPWISMAAVLLAALITPVLAAASPLGVVGDLILLAYLFVLPRVLFSLAGLDTGSTFGGVSARRELLIAALIEPALILVIFVLALLAGSTNLGTISYKVANGTMPLSLAFWLSMAAFAFVMFVEMGRLPFDLAEAEQELQEGPLSEYSGRSLALVKWGLYLKQIVLVALFLGLFVPFGSMTRISAAGLLIAIPIFLLKAAIVYFVVALLENAMARMRFLKAPAATWLALGAAVLSFVFYLANV